MTLAKQYFESRTKLADVVRGVIELAEGLKTKEIKLSENDERLCAPLRVVVCGDKESGKTSLIETLFGLTSGCSVSSGAIKYTRSDLVVIESPPVSELERSDREWLQQQLDRADYILWGLSVSNPWSASTWDLVSEQSDNVLELSCILLLQADLRDAGELCVLEGHIRDLCFQRARRPLSIIPVSASKKDNVGIAQCLQSMDRAFNDSKSRRKLLREVYNETYSLMMELEDRMDYRARTLESDKGYLQSIEAEIERDKGEKVKTFASDFSKWGELYEAALIPVLTIVKRKTGVIGITCSLFGRGDDAVEVERELLKLVEERAGQQGLSDGKLLLDSCGAGWLKMKPHLEERLAVELGDLEKDAFLDQIENLADRLSKRARHAVMKLRMRRVLDHLLMENRRKEKYILCVCLLFIVFAGVFGSLRMNPHPFPALVALGGASFALVGYCWTVYRAKKTILAAYGGGLVDLRTAFSESVLSEYEAGIHEFYKGYLPMFENMKRHIAEARESLVPKQKQWNDLFLELKAVEQEF